MRDNCYEVKIQRTTSSRNFRYVASSTWTLAIQNLLPDICEQNIQSIQSYQSCIKNELLILADQFTLKLLVHSWLSSTRMQKEEVDDENPPTIYSKS